MGRARHLHRLTLVSLAMTSAVAAMVAPVAAHAQSQAGDKPKEDQSLGAGTLEGRDTSQTSVGGTPFTDASPRLPRVDYDDSTVPEPVSASARRGETVLNRSRPDYDPVGIHAGGFRILPEVSARVGYDSNVFSQTDGHGDVYGRLRGAVRAQSEWGRNAAEFDGFVDERAFATYGSEDGITYNAHASGRYDFAPRSSINAGVQRGRVFIERGATTELLPTREPIRYNLTSANLGGRDQEGRFTLGLNGVVSHFDYLNAETPDGLSVDEQFRDFNLYSAQAEVSYATGAGPELFISLTGEARRFRVDTLPVKRDSDGLEVLGGVQGDITPLLRGRLGVGYLRYTFRDPTIGPRDGLGLDIRLDYLVTELTTISVRGRRELRNVSSVTRPAALSTTFSVGVDHELLRNLVVSADANYETSDYVNSPISVHRYGGDVGAFYLLNRRIRFDANISYFQRDGSGAVLDRDFSAINSTLGVTFRL